MLPEQDIFLETLHRTYFNKLTPYAESALRDTARAQDVVQDAFHDALLHIDRLMVRENPGGWLMKTVKKQNPGQRTGAQTLYVSLSLAGFRSFHRTRPTAGIGG